MKKYLDIFNSIFGSISVDPPANIYKISILCAHYNNHLFLPDFIKSLEWQTYSNWEAIIVDDCSTMGDPVDIVLATKDTRIKYHRLNKNLGACAARNAAFDRSDGDFVVCIDPDDILHPEFCAALVKNAQANINQIIMFDYIYFGRKTGYQQIYPCNKKELLTRQWIPGTSMLNACIYRNIGGWDTDDSLRYGNQDWEFWINVWKHYPNIKVLHISLPLMLYRKHMNSISISRQKHDHETRKYILKKHYSLFERHDAIDSFITTGYAISIAFRILSYDIQGTITIILEAIRKCSCYLLLKYILIYIKIAFLDTNIGIFIKKYYKKFKTNSSILLYSSRYCRNFFWNHHAKFLFDKYGNRKNNYDSMVALLNEINPNKLLDIGCGNGRLFRSYIKAGVKVIVGQDISRTALIYAKKRNFKEVKLILSEIPNLKFDSCYFDITICNRVLQHIHYNSIVESIYKICLLSKRVYVNELSYNEYKKLNKKNSLSFYIYIHDYESIFKKFGFLVEKYWCTLSKDEPYQHRYIFKKYQ